LLIAVLVLASLPDSTPELAGRYLLPFVPGLGLAVALLVTRGGGSRSRSLIIAVLVAFGLIVSALSRMVPERRLPLHPSYSQRELEAIARELDERGHTWVDLVARLQGPAYYDVLGGLAATLEPSELPIAEVDAGLLLLAFEPEVATALLAELPASTEALELPGLTVLLIDTAARLDRARVAICPERGDCEPVNLGVTRRVTQAHPKAWIADEYVGGWLRDHEEEPLRSLSWRFPVRPGPATTLVLPPYNEGRCSWRVVAVDGFDVADIALPTATLELPAEASGSVVVSREVDEGNPSCRLDSIGFPPAPLELDPSWTRLRAALLESDGGAVSR
jgi:hypothetical protein